MFDIQTRALLLVNINTCSISIDKYICWLVFVCIVRIYIQKFAYSSVLLCLLDGVSGQFSYIVAVSFIGVGIQSTRRIPRTCRKSLTNSIT